MSDHDRRYTTAYHDHERDLRKHDPRPGDRDFPLRLERPITTAEDIAICVRGMKNLPDAAALIEQYGRMVAAIALHDDTQARLVALESPLSREVP